MPETSEKGFRPALNKLRNLYDTDSSLRGSHKITYRESGEAEALHQFLFGLRGDLQPVLPEVSEHMPPVERAQIAQYSEQMSHSRREFQIKKYMQIYRQTINNVIYFKWSTKIKRQISFFIKLTLQN